VCDVCITSLFILCFPMWELSQAPNYKLVWLHLGGQCGTKVACHLYTPPWLLIWNWASSFQQPTWATNGPCVAAQNFNNPHQSQGLQLTHFLYFYIPALQCRPIIGWATPSIPGFTCSRLCNGHSLELLVLCKLVFPEGIADTRPPKALPLVGVLRSCSHVLSWV
jgi:hypothetical protein